MKEDGNEKNPDGNNAEVRDSSTMRITILNEDGEIQH